MNLDELLREAIAHPEKRSLFLQTLIKSDVYVICKNPVKPNPDGSVQMDYPTFEKKAIAHSVRLMKELLPMI